MSVKELELILDADMYVEESFLLVVGWAIKWHNYKFKGRRYDSDNEKRSLEDTKRSLDEFEEWLKRKKKCREI